jgi:hypothetical protein
VLLLLLLVLLHVAFMVAAVRLGLRASHTQRCMHAGALQVLMLLLLLHGFASRPGRQAACKLLLH